MRSERRAISLGFFVAHFQLSPSCLAVGLLLLALRAKLTDFSCCPEVCRLQHSALPISWCVGAASQMKTTTMSAHRMASLAGALPPAGLRWR